jgi:hypothetical protein
MTPMPSVLAAHATRSSLGDHSAPVRIQGAGGGEMYDIE